MRLTWSTPALSDLSRLHAFLAPTSRRAATQFLRNMRISARKLLEYPRLGERVPKVENPEIRRIFVRDYELRYEIRGDEIVVLRLWHAREYR